jgi:hypothetical protein
VRAFQKIWFLSTWIQKIWFLSTWISSELMVNNLAVWLHASCFQGGYLMALDRSIWEFLIAPPHRPVRIQSSSMHRNGNSHECELFSLKRVHHLQLRFISLK